MKSKIPRVALCLVLIGTMMATQVGVVAAFDLEKAATVLKEYIY